MSFRSFALLLLLLAIPFFAQGQTTIHVPADQATIQAGINAANAGDTVLVAPGTYNETIDFKGKVITVTSAGGAAVTTINGDGIAGPAARFTNGEPRSSVLNGFTILHGGFDPEASAITGPRGAIYVSASSPTLSNNIISQSHCFAIDSQQSSPLIQGNELDNTLYSYGECASSGGFAISMLGSLDYLDGPGIPDSLPAVILGNTIQNNAQGAAGFDGGAAINAFGGSLVIEQNIIRNNTTLGEGTVHVISALPLTIVGNLIYGNTAAQISGGLEIQTDTNDVGGAWVILGNNTIFGNTLSSGSGSSSPDEIGSQIFVTGGLQQLLFVNNIIVGTSSSPALTCDTIYNYLTTTPPVFDHNDLFNSGGGPTYSGACPDQTGTYGNISVDPRFTNSSSGDLHLQPGSPAIDSGNNSAPDMLPTDIAGATRIQDASGLGYPVIDMGAFEASGAADAPATTLTLTPSTYTPGYFTPFVLTANATAGGQPATGPITFYMDSKSVGVMQADGSGTATFSPEVPSGLHAFIARYSGQGAFPPAVSVKFYVLFPEPSPILALTSSPNPSLLGQPVTFTVQVSSPDGNTPGPITLTDSQSPYGVLATLTPDASGHASFTTSALKAGSHQITASFVGNNTDGAAAATITQQVLSGSPTTTTLSCTPQTISLGGTSSLLAAVSSASGNPTGSLTLTDNTTPLTPLVLTNGAAAYSYVGTTAGAHTLGVAFPSTSTLAGSSASCSVNVVGLPSNAALSVTPTSTSFGSAVTLSAKVTALAASTSSSPLSGSITFLNGSTPLGTVTVTAGAGTLTLNTLPVGSNPVSCTYSGDTTFAPATCNVVPVQIAALPTTLSVSSSANPTAVSSPPQLTIHLTASGLAIPVGTLVTLHIGPGVSFTLATDASGSATITPPTLLPGSYAVSATFAGTSTLLGSTASLTQVITGYPTVTSLTVGPNPAYQGQPITMSATLAVPASAPAISGSITFYDGATVLGTTPLAASNQASITSTSLSLGTHTLTAAFATAGPFVGSTSAPVQETVLPSSFALTLNPATVTMHAGQTGATTLVLNSIGNFSGMLTLGNGALPAYASARFTSGTVTLAAGGSGSTTLQLNTAQDPGAVAALASRPRSSRVIFLAVLFSPLVLLGRRRRFRAFRSISTLLVLAAASHLLTGCGTVGYSFHLVPAGTYQIPITATDANHHQQSAVLTLTVEQ